MKLSIIIPIYNERENINLVADKVRWALAEIDYELIFVDDGSGDGSSEVLKDLSMSDNRIKSIVLNKNYGQTAAIAAGIDHSVGDIIVPMDGDLENDPADIPKLLQKIEEGFDVVSGWRMDRWKGSFVTRKAPSITANWLISKFGGLKLHDYGCTLKAYRSPVIKDIRLYGDMHRFIPAYAHWHGARVAEVPVNYSPRIHGQSKYGLSRVWRVLLDLITLKFLSGYATRPLHLFGNAGVFFIFLGIIAGAFAVYFKLSVVNHKDFIETPLPVIMAMMVVVGFLLIMMGLLAEILMRVYHESNNRKTYTVRQKIGLENENDAA